MVCAHICGVLTPVEGVITERTGDSAPVYVCVCVCVYNSQSVMEHPLCLVCPQTDELTWIVKRNT